MISSSSGGGTASTYSIGTRVTMSASLEGALVLSLEFNNLS